LHRSHALLQGISEGCSQCIHLQSREPTAQVQTKLVATVASAVLSRCTYFSPRTHSTTLCFETMATCRAPVSFGTPLAILEFMPTDWQKRWRRHNLRCALAVSATLTQHVRHINNYIEVCTRKVVKCQPKAPTEIT